MGSKQHLKWAILLAQNIAMFGAPIGWVLVNFSQQNFQDIILGYSGSILTTQKWCGGYLKKITFFHRTPYPCCTIAIMRSRRSASSLSSALIIAGDLLDVVTSSMSLTYPSSMSSTYSPLSSMPPCRCMAGRSSS
jgi:hypothetical protein